MACDHDIGAVVEKSERITLGRHRYSCGCDPRGNLARSCTAVYTQCREYVHGKPCRQSECPTAKRRCCWSSGVAMVVMASRGHFAAASGSATPAASQVGFVALNTVPHPPPEAAPQLSPASTHRRMIRLRRLRPHKSARPSDSPGPIRPQSRRSLPFTSSPPR